ncbi:MAG: hypothetical protein HKN46_09505 [Acidimicrobiia bacterium]|nr:hypothetical protein [Acidimicrobiia bacterium]
MRTQAIIAASLLALSLPAQQQQGDCATKGCKTNPVTDDPVSEAGENLAGYYVGLFKQPHALNTDQKGTCQCGFQICAIKIVVVDGVEQRMDCTYLQWVRVAFMNGAPLGWYTKWNVKHENGVLIDGGTIGLPGTADRTFAEFFASVAKCGTTTKQIATVRRRQIGGAGNVLVGRVTISASCSPCSEETPSCQTEPAPMAAPFLPFTDALPMVATLDRRGRPMLRAHPDSRLAPGCGRGLR